ncbi:protein folded gastrulation [Lucilia cuprina]|uniref:protein folded gastrulation n=1 Tax=Lucilia cuprina TaxID=7375 RepID=UPI001F06C75C|nr:protein folded gastrulation [Lucilia cuprina]XP_046801505.1 protein folded gastrulation [Lucilia cuprina]
MYFTPTIFIVKLLVAMQVLMTLDMPLSTTMALPVTSKPIESTVENLAWQAWIELPPEQKQQVKSRKVTPKSIFTLPLRVECPEGHKQVDTKCIPIVIGSNDVLIDLNALGLLVGNTQTDELYDYDDVGEEMGSPLPYGSEMQIGEAEKSVEGITVELKPPSKDEPLKFNIFENKFNIFHEEPLEDYSSISNEGVQSSEKQQNFTLTTPQTTNKTTNAQANITAINDLVSEASNISENSFEIYMQREKGSSLSTDNVAHETYTLTTLADDPDFRIEAISLPAAGFEILKPNKLSIVQNDSSIQLVTSIMDTDTTTSNDDHDRKVENDLQTLLQTESFLPMLQQATATSLQDTNVATAENSSLTTISSQEPSESSLDTLSLNVENEEMTTLPNVMEQDVEVKDKQEYTRSVTRNPLISNDSDSNVDDNANNDDVKDTTLESVTNDEPLETTTPIQLDDTTIIETSSSLSTTPATQVELKELLLQQEQAQKDFEELQRMRKGQKDQQHVVLKKSKVEPVEVLSTTTEAATTTTVTNLPTETETKTKTQDEFVTKTPETAVTPLLTVHNEKDNNDRFYYQHFAKQDSEEIQRSGSVTTTIEATEAAAATKATEIETIPLSSEIDLTEELRLINELVKGIRPATTLTTIKSMQATITTTENPTTKTILPDKIQSSSSSVSLSESSTMATKPTPSTLQIWSKIMPLLTSTTPKSSSHENFKTTKSSTLSTQEVSNDIQISESTPSSSMRSNRNSKIIRINGFNSISTGKDPTTSTSTTTEETTTIKDFSASGKSENLESSTESNTYQPYWWLPVAWRLDKPISSEKQVEKEQEVKSEEQPLLLRFWSAYHAPKSS